MKKFIKQIAFVMALALVVTSFAAAAPAEAATISLGKKSKTLYVGGAKGFYLKADGTKVASTVKGTYSSLKKQVKGLSKTDTVRFTSDNKAVATVYPNSGKIKANGKGTATITCTVRNKAGKKIATLPFKVTVNNNAKEIKIVNAPANGVVPIGEKAYDLNGDYGKATVTDKATWKLVEGADIAAIDAAGVITTKKAGKFKVQAYTYQSKKFKGATAESAVLELEAAASLAGVKASGIRSFTATFDSNMNDLVDRAKFEVFYTLNGAERAVSIDTVTVDKKDETGKTVNVTLFNNFEEDTEYSVRYTTEGEKYSFKLASLEATDVTKIVLNNPVVEVLPNGVELDFDLLNNDGVNLTAGHKGNLTFTTEDYNSASITDNKITFWSPKQKANVKATYSVSYVDEDKQYKEYTFNQTFTVTSIEEAPVNYTVGEWSVVQKDGTYDKAKLVNFVALNDEDSTLTINLLSSKDGKSYLFSTLTGFTLESANEAILLFKEENKLVPVKAGSTSVIVRDDNAKVVATFPINVNPKRVPASVSVIPSKTKLNVSAGSTDQINVTVKVLDNYSQPLKGAKVEFEVPTAYGKYIDKITANLNDNLTDKAGIATLVVSANDAKIGEFGTNAVPITYNVKATFGEANAKTSLGFSAQKVTDMVVKQYLVSTDKTTVDTTITKDTSSLDFNISVAGYNAAGYYITDVTDDLYASKAAATDVVSGGAADPAFYYRVGGKELGDADGNFKTLKTVKPISLGAKDDSNELVKLGKGTYQITLVKVVSKKNTTVGVVSASEATLNTTTFTVTDNQKVPTATLMKSTTQNIENVAEIISCFSVKDADGSSIDSDKIIEGDWSKGTNAVYVKSLKVKVSPSSSGDFSGKHFNVTVPVNATVRREQ